jgi:hypothetical protein
VHWRRLLASYLIGGAMVLHAPPARAQQPVGPEFKANTYFSGRQVLPSVAMSASGSFVVVWQSLGQDGSEYGIFGQRFAADGSRQGLEFRVNTHTADRQMFPDVAMDADGDFVVVWESFGQDGPFDPSVFGQRYDAFGVPQGAEFRVHAASIGQQRRPNVAMDAAGNFVAVWEASPHIAGQRFDATGTAQGAELAVSTAASYHNLPSVAAGATGEFVAVWVAEGEDGDGRGIFGQRFTAAGEKDGGAFQANSYTTSYQTSPSVAVGTSGRFAVVWQSYLQDGGGSGVFGQAYDGSGDPWGEEFQVNSFTTFSQQLSQAGGAVAADGDGGFVVAWDGLGPGYGLVNAFGRRFTSAGKARGTEFQANTYATANQQRAAVATDGKNRFVVVWESELQDGSERGIFGQRFFADVIFGDGFE